MIYAIGDIHGCLDELLTMMDRISFDKEKDRLYFVGDYIDRGLKTYQMFRWLEKNVAEKCFFFVRGNHEQEYVAYIDLLNSVDSDRTILETATMLHDRSEYFHYYGTVRGLIRNNKVNIITLSRWADMFRCMPTNYKIDVNGQMVIVVHAGYNPGLSDNDKEEFELYARENAYLSGGEENTIIIAGHTPTLIKDTFVYNDGEVFKYYNQDKKCTFYDIDCGCVFKGADPRAKLACIRLDDQEIFYVKQL